MASFAEIEAAAAHLLGSREALAARLVKPEPPESLAMIGDDRYLSVMCRRIFRAGLTHRLVDARWPAFEIAFADFDPATVAALTDDELKRLATDESLIRHKKKIAAVRTNAQAIGALIEEFGAFGVWLADWEDDEIVDLWLELKQRFVQLGGQSGPRFLRMIGKDTFLLTDWVAQAMTYWGVADGKLHTKAGMRAAQARFNDWQAETGRPMCQLSQILAFSISKKTGSA